MKKYIERFHYLTQDLPHRSHTAQVQLACESGAKWIQYRCLSKGDHQLIPEIEEIAAICDDWGTTLILTDHAHLLDRIDAQGVHIEDMAADFSRIREQIGDGKTLGASANTFEQIQRIAESGVVDYIGCGPFALTQTKPNDLPLLGTAGYELLVQRMADAGIEIPLIAVGGIQIADVDGLLKTGVYGIAVSAAVNLRDDPQRAYEEFYHKIY
ncbi:MAG TPA: thiamine phosphate synthase [Sphingobacteriaceae bacterium]